MYPLNMTSAAIGGYAVANSADEHKALNALGYEPKLQQEPDADPGEADAEGHTVESVRAKLDELGISYDKRVGLAKLLALLPA